MLENIFAVSPADRLQFSHDRQDPQSRLDSVRQHSSHKGGGAGKGLTLELVMNHESTSTLSMNTITEGHWILLSNRDGKSLRLKNCLWWSSNKLRNRAVKMRNGNRINRNMLKISHWNMGNAMWQNKRTELDALILDKHPDLLYISEANLMDNIPDHERYVEGYRLYLPLTMTKHKCAMIVLLARQEIDIKIHTEWMHEDVAVIWASVLNGNRSTIKVGGVYREHQMLLKAKPNPTKSDEAQLYRWNMFLKGWKKASKK